MKSVFLAWGPEVSGRAGYCIPGIFAGTSGQTMPPLVNHLEEEAYLFTIILLILKDNVDFLASPGKRRVNERENEKSRQSRLFIPGI